MKDLWLDYILEENIETHELGTIQEEVLDPVFWWYHCLPPKLYVCLLRVVDPFFREYQLVHSSPCIYDEKRHHQNK